MSDSNLDRRKMLGMVGAGLAAGPLAAAGAVAGESKPGNSNGEKEVTAVLEGRLIAERDGRLRVEILRDLEIDIRKEGIAGVEQLTDPQTGRPFVRIRVADENTLLDFQSKLFSVAQQSDARPLVFQGEDGLAFTSGESIPTGSEGDGSAFAFDNASVDETRSIKKTCARYTKTLLGRVCDQYVGDINFIDD